MCNVIMMEDPYKNSTSVHNLVAYVLRDKDTKKRVHYYGGYGVNINNADKQIMWVKNYYLKTDNRMMRHIIVSFDEDITPYDAYILGWRISAYYGDRYQLVFGVHEDTEHIHIHIVFNTVSFIDGRKYSGDFKDLINFEHYVNLVYSDYFK